MKFQESESEILKTTLFLMASSFYVAIVSHGPFETCSFSHNDSSKTRAVSKSLYKTNSRVFGRTAQSVLVADTQDTINDTSKQVE